MIVWGGATLVVLLAIKVLKIHVTLFLFIVFVVYIDIFSYARATLAMAVYFLGIAVLFIKKEKYKSYLGLVIIGMSYIFHHSILIAIAALFAIFIPINKRNIKSYLISSPIIFILIAFFIKLFVFGGIINIPDMEDRVDTYVNMTASERNINGIIQDVIMYMLFFYPFVIITHLLYFKKNSIAIKNEVVFKFYKIILILVVLSLSFLTVGLGNTVFTYRILYMTFLPIAFIITWLYCNKILKKRQLKLMLLFGILYTMTLFISQYNHSS